MDDHDRSAAHAHILQGIVDDVVTSGRSQDLDALFHRAGARVPKILWDPAEADLQSPILTQFFRLCHKMRDAFGDVTFHRLDLDSLAPLMDWLILVDVENNGEILRYAHYGKVVANLRGRNMTGHRVEALGGHIGLFFESLYRAALIEKRWLSSVHEPPRDIFARVWRRLIVPVLEPRNGNVCRFAVLTVPDNELQAGLEIVPDPILITDAQMNIRFANRAARKSFDQPTYRGTEDISLEDFTGMILQPSEPPEVMALRDSVADAIRERVTLAIGGTLKQEFFVTLSATSQFGRSFYVITMRPVLAPPTASS